MNQSIMNIDDQNIPRVVERFIPTANSLNQYSILFTYSNSEWGDLSKYCTFTNNQDVSEQAIVTNDIVIIPQSVLSGVGDVSLVTMTLFGINDTDRWTTKEIGIYVNQNNFQPVQIIDEPDVWQQYLTQMENYVNEANEAVDKADEAITKYPYIGSDKYWYVWDVNSGEFINTGVLANNAYVLPIATEMDLGGVKIGSDISIDVGGAISVDTTTIATVEYLDDEVSGLETKISDEATTRETADTTLQDNIDTNTTNIATNTANISTNTTNIFTNTQDIATNATAIASKVDKVDGYGLSENNFSDEDLAKLNSLESYTAGDNIDITNGEISVTGIPTSTSDLINNSGYITTPTTITITDNDVTIETLESNYIYNLTSASLTSVTISAVSTSWALDTALYFTTGSSSFTFSYPNTMGIIGTVEFSASTKYVVSIDNNILVVGMVS